MLAPLSPKDLQPLIPRDWRPAFHLRRPQLQHPVQFRPSRRLGRTEAGRCQRRSEREPVVGFDVAGVVDVVVGFDVEVVVVVVAPDGLAVCLDALASEAGHGCSAGYGYVGWVLMKGI